MSGEIRNAFQNFETMSSSGDSSPDPKDDPTCFSRTLEWSNLRIIFLGKETPYPAVISKMC